MTEQESISLLNELRYSSLSSSFFLFALRNCRNLSYQLRTIHTYSVSSDVADLLHLHGTAHRVKTPPYRSTFVIQSNVVLVLSSHSPTSHTLLLVIWNRDSNCAKHTRNLRFIHSSSSKHAQTLTAPYSTCPIISKAVCQFVTLLTSLDQRSASWHSSQSSSVLAHIFQGRHSCAPIKLTWRVIISTCSVLRFDWFQMFQQG